MKRRLSYNPLPKIHDSKEWLSNILMSSKWIVHFFIIAHKQVAIFQRAGSGIWGPISETWEPIDAAHTIEASFILTVKRGAHEEANLEIPSDKIMPTGFQFQTADTNGNPIKGHTFFAQVSQADISTINLNAAELSDFRLADVEDALNSMHHPEAIFGLKTIYSKTLF